MLIYSYIPFCSYAKTLDAGVMKKIRPTSDLRNHFVDISKTVHETVEPIFLTKNGYCGTVSQSKESFKKLQFEKLQFEEQLCLKLEQAEKEAELTKQRYSTDDILAAVESAIQNSHNPTTV